MAKKRKRKKKKEGKWIQAATKSMRARGTAGSFAAWCRRRGYSKVTLACIQKGLKSRSPAIRKKANFARNVRK